MGSEGKAPAGTASWRAEGRKASPTPGCLSSDLMHFPSHGSHPEMAFVTSPGAGRGFCPCPLVAGTLWVLLARFYFGGRQAAEGSALTPRVGVQRAVFTQHCNDCPTAHRVLGLCDSQRCAGKQAGAAHTQRLPEAA